MMMKGGKSLKMGIKNSLQNKILKKDTETGINFDGLDREGLTKSRSGIYGKDDVRSKQIENTEVDYEQTQLSKDTSKSIFKILSSRYMRLYLRRRFQNKGL